MKLKGQIFQITDVAQFFLSYSGAPDAPDRRTYQGAAGLKIHLQVANSATASLPLFEECSMYVSADSEGHFTFDISDRQEALMTASTGVYVTVFQAGQNVVYGGISIPTSEPLYRSASFRIRDQSESSPLKIYYLSSDAPRGAGVTQDMVDQQINTAKAGLPDLKKLQGTICDGYVEVHGSGSGATVDFDVLLAPSWASDLNVLVEGTPRDIDIDLPGPDFLVGLCVSKKELRGKIDAAVSQLMVKVNKDIEQTIIAAIAGQAHVDRASLERLLSTGTSTTIRRLDYLPGALRTVRFGNVDVPLPTLTVVPQPTIGLPRNPARIAEVDQPRAAIAGPIDCIATLPNGKTYATFGAQYVRYSDSSASRIDPGYPKPIGDNWGHLPSEFLEGFDSMATLPDGKTYITKGAHYVRYSDANASVVDPTYPRPLLHNWGKLPTEFNDGFDSIATLANGKTYISRGAQYIRYSDPSANTVDHGYPKPLAGNWGYLPQEFRSGIDAMATLPNGKTYICKGDQYIRYSDPGASVIDTGYPKSIKGNWG
ncbi:MAG: hemopexin repeat-containing protein [Dokdonella sp.]